MFKTEFPECVPDEALEDEANELVLKSKLVTPQKKNSNATKSPQKKIRNATKTPKPTPREDTISNMYRQHRARVLNAKSEIDAKPPDFTPTRITGVHKLRDDAQNFMKRTKENLQILMNISHVMRTHGKVDAFRTDDSNVVCGVQDAVSNLESLEKSNKELGERLKAAQCKVVTGLRNPDEATREFLKRKFPVKPLVISDRALRKYYAFNMEIPKTDADRKRLLRPCIYFDIALKGIRPLGRLEIQLYTEAAPMLVLELVRACMCNMRNRFKIVRLFPTLWLDLDVQLNDDSRLKQPLEYDAKVIDHGHFSYVLSFSKQYIKGFPETAYLTLSFKPLSVVNGQRVGVGRVIRGHKICECIQTYGTKNGTLSRPIIFTGCGVV